VLEVQPTFVHAGVADALKSAGKWATPPLEEWTAVEAAIEKEKARLDAEAGRQREAAQQAEAAAERADADGGDAQGGAAAEHGLDSNDTYYPEQIGDHDRPRTVELRRLLIKWRGWSCRPQDLTWEPQAQLIEDGHEQLVYEYLTEKKLKLPEALEDFEPADDDEASSAQEEEQDLTPLHPQIPAVDLPTLLQTFASPIGNEMPNLHVRELKLPANATAAQRDHYEMTTVEDDNQRRIHKATAMANEQAQAQDNTPGAGRIARYTKGVKYAIIADDADGTGFEYGSVYEMHMDEGQERRAGLTLDGALSVCYVRLLELHRLCGNTRQPRLSIKKGDASFGSAVVLPLLPRARVGRQPRTLSRTGRRQALGWCPFSSSAA